MKKRVLAIVVFGLSVPAVALAATTAACCCPGLVCCILGCPMCP